MFDTAQHGGKSREIVRKFVTEKLYPTDTPEFEVGIITIYTHNDYWWSYLDTTLPDDMLYRVSWPVEGDGLPDVSAYKKEDV